MATPSPKSLVHYVFTQDGWKIALHHHPGKRRNFPVFLVHGLASNASNMDLPLKDLSLARYLSQNGFDAWVVDLRGSGLSKKKFFKRYRWYFDDFVFQDLPAAVEKILEITQAPRLHWIGHSLGGLLAYPFAQYYSRKNILQSLTTIAAPVTTSSRPGYLKHTYRWDTLLRLIPVVPYRTLSKVAKIFADYLLGREDHILFAKENMTREILTHILEHAVESVPSSLLLQIHDWLRHNHFVSKDGKINFMGKLEEITCPILMIAGSVDSFTTMADIRLAFRKIPNAKKELMVFGKSRGHETEYGHIDLLLGKNAPKEVYPHILRWLEEHDNKK
jgi:pimeloyl-ACP methyl ester carboxylesterase